MQESGEWEVGGGEMCSRDLAGHPEVWQWRCAGGESQRAGPLRLLHAFFGLCSISGSA